MGIAVEVGLGAAGSEVDLPAWVNGTASHTWSPRLGGGVWYQQQAVVTAIAPEIVDEYPRPPLVGLRSKVTEQGYRFDLNSWDANATEYEWWSDRASHEWVMQTFEAEGDTDFFWSMPCPDPAGLVADPDAVGNGAGFRWQKAAYYAAYLQYLIEDVSMTAEEYNALSATYDFFTDATCATVNTTSESAVEGNWANLRAKRGHPDPYPILWVVIGIEPHGDAQETLSGSEYGAIAEDYKDKIRARAGALSTIPLGLHSPQWGGAPSDFSKSFFKDMMDACTPAAFSYLDVHHHYRQGATTDQLPRIYPTLLNVDTGTESPGWEMYWIAQSSWQADYSKYLWVYEDSRAALTEWGETASRWQLGNAEHGLVISSGYGNGNDFGAGIHWALWIADIARYNAVWDCSWLLCEQGFTHAFLQYEDSHVTRTPGYYVYQMAQALYGLEYLPVHTLSNNQYNLTYSSTNYESGTCDGYAFRSDDLVIRVFRNASTGHVYLWVVNKNTSNTASVTGFEAATLVSWKRLSATALVDENPVGNHINACGQAGATHAAGQAWHAEWIYPTEVSGSHTPGQAFTIQPLSVNLIEVS